MPDREVVVPDQRWYPCLMAPGQCADGGAGFGNLSAGLKGGRRRRGVPASVGMADARVDERLVYTTTQDGLELKGVLIRRRGATAGNGCLLVWIHTRQQGFAEPEYVGIGRSLALLDHHFLSVETRGHDFGAWYRTPEGPSLHGSAWEYFSDCVHDLGAWVAAAQAMGYERLVLISHGFGGAKALHFQAQRQLPQVEALVLASSGASVRDKLPPGLEETAQRMVDEGRGQDLLPFNTTGQNYASTVSAQYYLARCIVEHGRVASASFVPVRRGADNRVAILDPAESEGAAVVTRTAELSSGLGTRFETVTGEVYVRCS